MGVAKLSAEQLRNRELERELAIAREVRDILKKPLRMHAVVVFAAHTRFRLALSSSSQRFAHL